MCSFKKTTGSILKGMMLALYLSTPAIADDIEIYTSLGSSATTVKPNILFILDSSGSMGEPVFGTPSAPYDPTITYSGCYYGGFYYFQSAGSNPPGCYDLYNVFWKSSLQCDSALNGSLSTAGFYTDQLAQHRGSNVWDTISINLPSDWNLHVECKQDQGVHGRSSSPTPRTYITNSSNGWQSSATNPAVWAGGGAYYTVYDSNYLNYLSSSRLLEMQKAVKAIVDAGNDINIGLMRFDGVSKYEGGPVVYAMEDIDTARSAFKTAVDDIRAGGNTPLAETYFEALNYFGGRNVYYGNASSPLSVASSKRSKSVYKSPIADACQKHTIIYLTDGYPTEDNISSSQLDSLKDFPSADKFCASNDYSNIYGSDADFSCLEYMAGWAYNNDVAYDSSIPAHVGNQSITTYTIGFDFSGSGDPQEVAALNLLKRTAKAGGGRFYEANDALSLVAVFNDIVTEVLAVNTTFSSPAVSINAFNRATNLDDLYFTLFKPSVGARWDGNLKKFKIAFDTNGDPVIKDANGNDAIDNATGFFSANATSFWTDPSIQDGAEVAIGGAAGELTTTRNVYTFTGTYSGSAGVLSPSNGNLTSAANALEAANSAVTEAMLNITGKSPVIGTIPYRETLLDWAYGIDVLDDDKDGSVTDARGIMGDPLHSEPALVQYGELSNGEPDLVAYVATNDGYLHAFNTQDGTEYFAFVPQELLPLLDIGFENSGVFGKAYGLDGNVVAWVNDKDKNGKIESGENVYLYVGMRRGGSNIYSLDVTNRNAPSLRWVIAGGAGDFAELGQTWSPPNVEKLMIGGVERTVLIFGGGYDTAQDVATTRTPDSIGRAIYIVDAETGQRLWWAGPSGSGADLELPEMQYSIPARVKPLDIDGDGYIDRLYTADMGGQLWRFDIPLDDLNKITGGRVADLAQDGSISDVRRFYYPPDVSLIFEEGNAPYLAIVAASGYRAHPLNTDIQDRMYMIRDYDIYKAPTSYVTVTEADLYDTTSNIIGEGSDSQINAAASALGAAKGWYITFSETGSGNFIGEKSLSEPLILNGTAIVTTYIPDDLTGASVDACTPREGTGRVFYVNIVDGTPTYNNDGTVGLTRADRWTYLKRGGIPPSPNVIITEEGMANCVGTECKKSLELDNIQKTYWYEKESD